MYIYIYTHISDLSVPQPLKTYHRKQTYTHPVVVPTDLREAYSPVWNSILKSGFTQKINGGILEVIQILELNFRSPRTRKTHLPKSPVTLKLPKLLKKQQMINQAFWSVEFANNVTEEWTSLEFVNNNIVEEELASPKVGSINNVTEELNISGICKYVKEELASPTNLNSNTVTEELSISEICKYVMEEFASPKYLNSQRDLHLCHLDSMVYKG